MVVYFRDNVIQLWLSKPSISGEDPDIKVCMEQRQFVLDILSQHLAAVKLFVKCSKGSANTDYTMFEMEKLFEQAEVLCDCVPNRRHAVATEELTKYWCGKYKVFLIDVPFRARFAVAGYAKIILYSLIRIIHMLQASY